MAVDYKAQNCILEIGDVVGVKEIVSSTQVGTTNITVYEGCEDNPNFVDQGFNNQNEERVKYSGTMTATAVNLGGSLQELIGIGNIQIQGCHLTYLTHWNNLQLEPGYNHDSDKLVYFNLYATNGSPLNMPVVTPLSTAGGLRFEPKNDIGYDDNVAGRAIYFVDTNNTTGSGNNVSVRTQACFDIVSTFAGNHIILRGNGSDNIDDYSIDIPNMWSNPETHNFYISAYKHSAAWDSSGGSGSPFYWIGGSLAHKTYIGSYEGSKYRDANLGIKANDCFESNGILGITSSAFGMGSGVDSHDQYEIEISVSQLLNCKIDILEGQPYNNNIETSSAQDLIIDSVGVHRVCLAALKHNTIFGQTALNGGVTMMDNGKHYHSSNGSVQLINARALDSSLPARCTVEYIKITKKDTKLTQTAVPNIVENSYTIDDIDWNHLNILDSETLPLALTYQINNLNDLTKQKTGFSKTFTIPADRHNCTILEPMLAVNAERTNINWQPARISVDGVTVFKGMLRVEKGITGNGGYFSCHIIQDSIDWANLLDEKKICDLAFAEDGKKNFQQVVSSWTNHPQPDDNYGNIVNFFNHPDNYFGNGFPFAGLTPPLNKDFIYGVANYGEWNCVTAQPANPYYKNSNDFHPAMFAYRIIHKIFNDIGYKLESNFIESETFRRLIHPFTSGEDYMVSNLYGSDSDHSTTVKRFVKTTAGGTFDAGGECPNTGLFGGPMSITRYDYPNLVPGFDNGNNWSSNSQNTGYTVPFTSNYDISIGATGFVAQSFLATSWSYFRFVVLKNGQWLTYGNNAYVGGTRHVDEAGIGDGLTINDQAVVPLQAGDVISVKFEFVNYSDVYNAWCDYEEVSLNIFPVVSGVAPEVDVNISKVLPCVSQKNYLKGITELFNLQWIADKETKVVNVEPYDEFFGTGKVLDWTEKLDRTSWTDKFIAKDQARNVSFEYKEDSSDKGIETLYDWREQNNLDLYKSYELINLDRFKKETLKLGSTIFHSTWRFNNYGVQPNPTIHPGNHPHAPNAYAWGDLTWTPAQNNSKNPLMPVIWTEEGGLINGYSRPPYKKLPKAGIRILNYYGVQECSKYKYIKEDATTFELEKYPYMDWINGWKKNVAVDEFNLSWDDFDDGYGNVSPGLFTKYWKNAYNKVSGGAALRTCKMALTSVDINLFDYRDIIHLKIDNVSTYWTVYKIKDYKPNKRELTTVELVEWRYDSNYATPTTVRNKVTQPEGQVTLNKDQLLDKVSGQVSLVEEKTNLEKIDNAINVDNSGHVELYGGELVVEETDGTICTVLYTDGEDLKKVYLQPEVNKKTNREVRNYNPNKTY